MQRIAVGLRTGHLLDRKDAERPQLVFDQQRLAQNRPHLFADDAHDDIGGAPRPKRYDDLHGLRGIFLLRRRIGAAEREDEQQQGGQALHVG